MPRTAPSLSTNEPSARATRRHRRDRRALLSAADERRLAQTIEAGRDAAARLERGEERDGDIELVAEGDRARDHFIEANVRLVQSIANRYNVPVHLDREDIVQDGMIGLEKAVAKFDWRRGYKFSTYATWWIRQAIQRGLESSASTIRIPGHRSLARLEMLSQLESMDRPIGDGSDTLGTLVACDQEGPAEAAERLVTGERVDALLDHLDPTTAYVVTARFGLRGHQPATFSVIAEELGVTPQAVRRRVERAIAKLRTHAEPIAA
jgi:RNA polymerase sigma factor (sigma-70 family)